MPSFYRPEPAARPTPAELADWLGGQLLDADAAPDRITGLAPLQTALETEVSFITDPKYLKHAADSKAGLLLTPRDSDLPGRPRIELDHVWTAVADLMNRLYAAPKPAEGIHPTAVVEQGATVGKGVTIGPACWVGAGSKIGDGAHLVANVSVDRDCVIGAGSRLHPGVSLQGVVRLGRNVVIHSNCTLGADGFKYESGKMGILKIPQVGIVIVEDEVEIGANTTIDRAFIHETRIGYGTKIDNQVQIGHNCNVGRFCIICGCAGLAGSVTLGDFCILGGDVGVRDGVTLGAGTQVGGGGKVFKDWPAGSVIAGSPAFNARDWIRASSLIKTLPEMTLRIRNLEKHLQSAEPATAASDTASTSEP